MYFSGDNITEIIAVTKPNVTKDMIKPWVDENYPYEYWFPNENYESHLYQSDWWNMNPIYRLIYVEDHYGNFGGISFKKEFL